MRLKTYLAYLAMSVCALSASATTPSITDVDIRKAGSDLKIDMLVSLEKNLQSTRDILVTPVLRAVDGTDSLRLDPIRVAGRSRYYTALRNDSAQGLYRAEAGLQIPYAARVKMSPWMDDCELRVAFEERGCCGKPEDMVYRPVAHLDFRPAVYEPAIVYMQPAAAEAVKTRSLSGSAYIDFPVNMTTIYPDYRRNPQELAKINATIDSVRLDKDVTIKLVTIKGYASPEGSYSNNERLAKGRTKALKEYVQRLHHFPSDLMKTSYEPEDWAGLRRYVESSSLPYRYEILSIIDGPLAPDPKNESIRRRFPEQYNFLLKEVYPGLRHSDYTIEYVIRTYTDVDEIKRLVVEAPQKLSLNEFMTASRTMEPGTPEYDNLWATAVKMYPQSPVACVNAANAAMSSGHYKEAGEYLERAGYDGDAIYARGVLAAMQGDYERARVFFEDAARKKVASAPAALEHLDEMKNRKNVTLIEQ